MPQLPRQGHLALSSPWAGTHRLPGDPALAHLICLRPVLHPLQPPRVPRGKCPPQLFPGRWGQEGHCRWFATVEGHLRGVFLGLGKELAFGRERQPRKTCLWPGAQARGCCQVCVLGLRMGLVPAEGGRGDSSSGVQLDHRLRLD